MMAVSEWSVIRANDLEIERLDIKVGHRVGVFEVDGEVAQFGADSRAVWPRKGNQLAAVAGLSSGFALQTFYHTRGEF